MKLHIVFAQRRCSHPGQWAPEAIAIMDEYSVEEGGLRYLNDKLAETKADSNFVSAEIFVVDLGDAGGDAIDKRLNYPLEVPGTVEDVGGE